MNVILSQRVAQLMDKVPFSVMPYPERKKFYKAVDEAEKISDLPDFYRFLIAVAELKTKKGKQ